MNNEENQKMWIEMIHDNLILRGKSNLNGIVYI